MVEEVVALVIRENVIEVVGGWRLGGKCNISGYLRAKKRNDNDGWWLAGWLVVDQTNQLTNESRCRTHDAPRGGLPNGGGI